MPRSRIKAELQHMAASDLLAMVDGDTLSRVKGQDGSPELRAYAIAHEGPAEGTAVGIGQVVMQYAKQVIAKLGERLKLGTQLFLGHGPTNGHAGRQAIGEVVGKASREIEGRATQVAAVWIYPEHRDKRLDVASIEADIEFTYGGDGQGKAVDVGEITGIALGNSDTETPGFPGATLLATVQAFVQGKGSAMTLEEIKKALEEGGYKPSDVFARDALAEDNEVKAVVKESVDKETETERTAKREIQKRLGEKLDKQKEELASLRKETVQAKTSTVLKALADERKLTDQQRQFVERRLGSFSVEADSEDDLKSSLNNHLDKELKEFRDYQTLLGVKPDGEGDGDKKGAPPDEGPAPDADYSTPESNDFIAQSA